MVDPWQLVASGIKETDKGIKPKTGVLVNDPLSPAAVLPKSFMRRCEVKLLQRDGEMAFPLLDVELREVL